MKFIYKKMVGLFITVSLSISLTAHEKPNIIWLMAEDIAPDIECYGMQAVNMPNLNKLAESGIKFTNTFVTSPGCSPSRSAMLTGVSQNKINAQHHRSNKQVPLPSPYVPFTKLLRNSGYTCILGSNLVFKKGRKTDVNFKSSPVGNWDGKENFGLFDKFDEITKEDQPFFAQIQLKVTHRGDWWDEIRKKSTHPVNPDSVVLPPYMADHPVIRQDWAKYLDQIEYMDREVGVIVQDLKDKGIYDNTVIIFIGDNGRCNIRGKGYLFDAGIRIPFILSWPDGIHPGQIRDNLVSSLDITATILHLAKVKAPEYMEGKSVLKKDFSREYVFSLRDYYDEIIDKSRSITTQRYKYIRHYMPEVPYDAGQAYLEFYRPAVHIMRKLKWEKKLSDEELYFFEDRKPKEELYDLEDDPYELNNLAKNAQYSNILNELRAKLLEAERKTSNSEHVVQPVVPISVEILSWVKYKHPNEYREMLEGKEIGFQRLRGKYIRQFRN